MHHLLQNTLTAWLVLPVIACHPVGGGNDADRDPLEAYDVLCTGGEDIVMGYRGRLTGNLVGEELVVLYENGTFFLYFDGFCRYWVNTSTYEWRTTKTGRLTEDEAQLFAQEVNYDEWSELSGRYGTGDTSHPSFILFHGTTSDTKIECEAPCNVGPNEVVAIEDTLARWADELWEKGEVMTGPVRLVVGQDLGWARDEPGFLPDPASWRRWPLKRSVEEIRSHYGPDEEGLFSIEPGDGILVSDHREIVALEEARNAFLEAEKDLKPSQQQAFGPVFETLQGALHAVGFRSALPIENDNGLVPEPD